MKELTVNSPGYWDWRFEGDWEETYGCEQTKYFGRLFLSALPYWLVEDIHGNGLSICDWGCAEGEAVQVWQGHFPGSLVSGIDVSENAIRKAHRKYGPDSFTRHDLLASPFPGTFDVIASSNVLEHFHDPWDVFYTVGKHANRHVALLVPYMEESMHPEHFYRFDDSNIPVYVAPDFELSFWRVVDCARHPERMWPGSQILLVYTRAKFLPVRDAITPAHEAEAESRMLEPALRWRQFTTGKEQHPPLSFAELHRKLADVRSHGQEILHHLNTFRSIAERNEQLSKEVGSTKTLLALRESELAARVDQNSRLAADMGQLRRELADLERSDEQIREENERLSAGAWESAKNRELVTDLRNSLSWKVTAPLRYVSKPVLAKLSGRRMAQRGSARAVSAQDPARIGLSDQTRLLEPVLKQLRKAKSIAIIPCAFPFNATVSQRPISWAKHLARQGCTVLFVVWQWSPQDEIPRPYQEVAPGIYHIPLFAFQENIESIASASHSRSLYICTLASKGLVAATRPLRACGVHIHYDIMDEWEEFHRLGQAPWFSNELERELVLLADTVTVVSQRLVEKFSGLRSDIALIPNGYDPGALGCEQFSAARMPLNRPKVIGYFGHLTDAWFDWEIVFHAARRLPETTFEIIGYGIPDDRLVQIEQLKNIRMKGLIPQKDLHLHAREWWGGVIPFKATALSVAVDPLKVYEYLHLGLPSVVTGISGIRNYPLVQFAEDAAGFVDAIAAIDGRPSTQTLAETAEFLRCCTWDERLTQMDELIRINEGFRVLYAK